jgi:enediyne biosynthesis protein E2
MPTIFGSARRLLMTPSLAKVSFAGRGFPGPSTDATERLEAIPQSVICGFEWGIDARSQWEVERRLSLLDPELQGFGYEGTTMAFTILDSMAGGRGHKTRDLLTGPGEKHIFLAYIGIGFAMARLPRPLWKKIVPDLTGSPYYPTMSWLAVDGYGFDRAYFETKRWVDEQRGPAPYPWLGAAEYFPRAVDQGIGRALWFIHGGRVADVAAAVRRFAAERQADLWSGVGLAATFAGGSAPDELAKLHQEAAGYQPELGQGAVFAIKARSYAGFVPEHTQVAARALAGLTVEAAVALADGSAVSTSASPEEPAYELWRARVRAGLPAARASKLEVGGS